MAEPRAQRARRRHSTEQPGPPAVLPPELWSTTIAMGLSLPEIAVLCQTNPHFNAAVCRDPGFWKEYLQVLLRTGMPADFPPALLAPLSSGGLLGPMHIDTRQIVRIVYRATTDLERTIRHDAAPKVVFPSAAPLGPVAVRFRYRFVPPVLPPGADPFGVPLRPAGVLSASPPSPAIAASAAIDSFDNPVDFWLDVISFGCRLA